MYYGPFIALLAVIATLAQAEILKNVALNKDAVQSVAYSPDQAATMALDGDRATCSMTLMNLYPFWTVDLGDIYVIDHVRLIDTDPQTMNFSIALSLDDIAYTDVCEHQGPVTSNYTCAPGYRKFGRWVDVMVHGYSYVGFCEVEVMSSQKMGGDRFRSLELLRGSGSVLQTIPVLSDSHCVFQCTRNAACVAVNVVNSATGLECQLLESEEIIEINEIENITLWFLE